MTISTAQYTIGTAIVQIVPPDDMPQRVTIHNDDSSQQIFLGNQTVTTSTGIHLDGKEERSITLNPGETLFAIASGNRTISVMIQTQ
jgi:hypothetical protein